MQQASQLWRDAVAFIVLILILIFRPQGLFGKNKEKKYRSDKAMTKFKQAKGFWLSILLSLIFFAVIQIMITGGTLNPFYQNTLMFIGINIILAASLHLVIGITGQFSIGHAGFLAVGAYASAIITMKLADAIFPCVNSRRISGCTCRTDYWDSKLTSKRGLS